MAMLSRNAFAHKFTTAMLDNDDLAVSPVSVYLCLGMVCLGATKHSKNHAQICELLGIDPDNEDGFMDEAKKMCEELLKQQDEEISIALRNSLWVEEIKPDFTEICANRLDADVRPLTGSAAINSWVAQHTKNMIQNIFFVDPPGPLVTVNVVSLKMKWTKSFDKEVTRPSDFYRSHDNNGPSNPVKCHMMTMKEHLNYTEFNGTQVVELPYGLEKDDKHFVAYILLPGRCVSVKETIQKTFEDSEKWAKVVDSMLDVKVRLELPRFTAESSFSLNESLQALGMDEAFDGNGHFTRLSDNPDVYLKEVVHAVKIQVDEAGTEAAAATAAVFATRGRAPPKDYVDMQVNRTFVFLLVNTVTKALLFAAVVKNPRPVE